jgi:hypothetical protein
MNQNVKMITRVIGGVLLVSIWFVFLLVKPGFIRLYGDTATGWAHIMWSLWICFGMSAIIIGLMYVSSILIDLKQMFSILIANQTKEHDEVRERRKAEDRRDADRRAGRKTEE